MTLVFPRVPGNPAYDILLGYTEDYFDVQRGLSHAYIAENPVEVSFTPHIKTRSATGGYTTAAAVQRPAQTVRLIEGSSTVVTDPQRTETGFNRARTWQLMGDWDAIVGVGDTFVYDGRVWSVESLMPWNGYERRATVVRHGS